jgi:hypothetical protein
MALRVPPAQIAHIKTFLGLPDEKIEALRTALTKAGPKFNIYDLAGEISAPLGLPEAFTLGIIQVLASLYLTRDWQEPTEKFVDREVFSALKAAQAFEDDKIDAQWKKLRQFLIGALLSERTVGTTVKAGIVLTQHERIFSGARIMTDLRPIYHLKVSEKPDAAVIIHMLKITQRDNFGHHEDYYFALDSNDIVTLQELAHRALAKEKTLKGLMESSGITVLNPKQFF